MTHYAEDASIAMSENAKVLVCLNYSTSFSNDDFSSFNTFDHGETAKK